MGTTVDVSEFHKHDEERTYIQRRRVRRRLVEERASAMREAMS